MAIYSTEANMKALKDACQANDMVIPGFTAWFCMPYLHTMDEKKNEKCFELFEQASRIAESFTCDYIHLGSDMISEYIVTRDATYDGAPAIESRLPSNVSYGDVMDRYVANLKTLSGIAEKHNLKFSIEPRANALINGADSFLAVAEKVGGGNMRCALDVMHSAFHREDFSIAIEKLGERLLIVQLCDARNGEMTHYPLGEGEVDMEAILKTLEKVGYDNYLMLELYTTGGDDPDVTGGWYDDSFGMIKKYLNG